AEEPHARLLVAEDESAKIAGEALNAHADAGEIVERLAREQPLFEVHLLHADVGVGAADALLHVDADETVLARQHVVDVELRRDLDFVLDGLESGAAAEVLGADTEILLRDELAAASEEGELAGIGGALIRRHGDAVKLERGVTRTGEGEKETPAENRKVALDSVAVERVPEARLGVDNVEVVIVVA